MLDKVEKDAFVLRFSRIGVEFSKDHFTNRMLVAIKGIVTATGNSQNGNSKSSSITASFKSGTLYADVKTNIEYSCVSHGVELAGRMLRWSIENISNNNIAILSKKENMK